MKFYILLLLPVLTSLQCVSQNQNEKAMSYGVMFYNLENLYDTINDPKVDDETFLPGADRKWDDEKYKKKLKQLSKVIATGADEMPVLVGLCEVENLMVVNDLAATLNLSAANYSVVHFDSPDERGIDVALMYNKNVFTPKVKSPIHVTIPADSVDYTRDILYVAGTININGKKEDLHIFVNHWPSRSEGEEVSAPKRAAAAQTLKHVIDSLNNKFTDPNIIIMGDFNDTPFDISIQKILMAQETNNTYADECLVNTMADKQKTGEGTYNFKGNWQVLDQIIVSESLLDKNSIDADLNTAKIVKQDWMLFHHDKYGDSPDRTYSGIKYIGGYSDHLPVYIELISF